MKVFLPVCPPTHPLLAPLVRHKHPGRKILHGLSSERGRATNLFENLGEGVCLKLNLGEGVWPKFAELLVFSNRLFGLERGLG